MKFIKEFRVAILFFLLIGVAWLLVQHNTEEKDYETGSLNAGNPDNSYLDTTKIYCCGD